MKFLLDENVDHRLAPYLNSLGYPDVTVIGNDYPPSLLDEQVLALARNFMHVFCPRAFASAYIFAVACFLAFSLV